METRSLVMETRSLSGSLPGFDSRAAKDTGSYCKTSVCINTRNYLRIWIHNNYLKKQDILGVLS